MSVNITKRRNVQYPVSKNKVVEVVEGVLSYMGFEYTADVNVLFTNDRSIKKINTEYRGIKNSTDVLSFPMLNYEFEANKYIPQIDEGDFDYESETLILGDIVISVETAQRQADEFGHGIEREVAFLLVHSVLHLLGYDHIDECDRVLMREKEEEILAYLRIYAFSKEQLYREALNVSRNAYARYSGLKVGAVALCGGRIYNGCNVENGSYGATVCAERVAVCNAISAGEKRVDVVAVAEQNDGTILPCGICRQFMSEFGDITVVYKNEDFEIVAVRLSELIPQAFQLKG